MKDQQTTIEQIKQAVIQFVQERDWQQFHSPKNISMALAIEAAELMEHFQWISMQESRDAKNDETKKQAISEEIADVFCYTIAIANEMGIDLAAAFENKMVKNRQKYPTAEIKGRYGHNDPNPTSS